MSMLHATIRSVSVAFKGKEANLVDQKTLVMRSSTPNHKELQQELQEYQKNHRKNAIEGSKHHKKV